MAARRRSARPTNPFSAHVRLFSALAVGIVGFLVLPAHFGIWVRLLAGWNCVAAVFLALILAMIRSGTPDSIRRRAAALDQGRWAMLFILVAGACFSLIALVFVQHLVKSATQNEAAFYLAGVGLTILLSWGLLHTTFALHYAHEYYGPAADENEDGLVGGLDFPTEKQPDYWDFMYFSFVIGMTCQVSDVQITRRLVRRLALGQGIVAFFFNTIILALTINIVAGLI